MPRSSSTRKSPSPSTCARRSTARRRGRRRTCGSRSKSTAPPTTREELVLSIGGGGVGVTRRWDEHTIEVALRAGMLRAVDAAERRGDLPGFAADALRGFVERAPLKDLIRGGISLSDLRG